MDRADTDLVSEARDETVAERLRPAPGPAPTPPPREAEPPPPARRKSGWGGWLITLLILGGLGWAGWRFVWPRIEALRAGGPAQGRRGASAAPQPVGVARIGTGDLQVVLSGIGTVTPLATITVQTQINGQLLAVGFEEGQMVKKGDFLAQIDPRPYEVTLAQAQGALAHDTGLLNQAKSDLARYTLLNTQNSIAKQQVSDAQFLVQQDEGLVTEDQASIDSAKLNLTYCHIVAPVSGRVGLRLVDPGNYVQTSSSTGLVVITQEQPISMIFDLPEDDIPEVERQMRAGPPLTVWAYDRTDTKLVATGTLTTVDNTVDTTTGTVKLRASFANTDRALFPNEFVNGRLLLQTLRGVVRVPVAAVQHGAPGTFVYLVKPDETVAVAVIKTGVTDGDDTQVLDGLKPGDEVVVDGTDRLREGAKVRVTPDAADPVASPDATPAKPSSGKPDAASAGDGQQTDSAASGEHRHRRGKPRAAGTADP